MPPAPDYVVDVDRSTGSYEVVDITEWRAQQPALFEGRLVCASCNSGKACPAELFSSTLRKPVIE